MAGESNSPFKTMIEIQNYAAQLRSMGAVIDEEMETARIISSLMQDKYRQFREAWRSVDTTKQSTAFLLARLKTWQLEEGESNKTAPPEELPQKAYSDKGKPKKSREEILEMKKKTKCHLYKNKRHWKSECPQRNRKDQKSEVHEKVERPEVVYTAGILSDLWINDSGANRHYCGRKEWFFEYEKYPNPKPVGLADNSHMLVVGVGKVKVKALIMKQWKEIVIHQVEYVPGGANLFSENILLDKGFEVRKNHDGDITYYRNG